MSANLVAAAAYLPEKTVANESLTQFPENAIPLIKLKTGVEARRHAADGQMSSDLAVEAAKRCIEKAGVSPSEIDAVIFASSTPDRLIPATATKVALKIGAENAFAFDVNSVCSGGLFLIEIARGMIEAGTAKTVLVVAADTYSKFLDKESFSTYPYFGDGAGAAIISSKIEGIGTLTGSVLHSDGTGYETITIKAGAGEIPSYAPRAPKDEFFQMDGKGVYDFAVSRPKDAIIECMQKFGLRKDDVTQYILHQANINIIQKISENLGEPFEKFFTNLQKYGNTASASVLIALAEYLESDRFEKRGTLILSSFGGGLSWGCSAISLD